MKRTQRGMSLIEVVVVIALMTLLLVLTLHSFKSLNTSKALDTDTVRVMTELEKARSLTLSSKYQKQYGVHFQSSQVILFEGATFVSGSASNTVSVLNSAVTLTQSLAGGGSDIAFDRLTGKTSQSGTVTLSLAADPASTKIITIYATGLVEVLRAR